MGAAQRKTPGMDNPGAAPLLDRVRGLSPLSFAVLFAAFFSPYFLIAHLVQTFLWNPPGSVSPDGVNLGDDFNAFYSAASLTLNGEAANAYDHAAMHAAQQQVSRLAGEESSPGSIRPSCLCSWRRWRSCPIPPRLRSGCWRPSLPFFLSFGAMPGTRWRAWRFSFSPARCNPCWQDRTACFRRLSSWVGLLNLERRPVLAGAILGLLSYKPHVAAAVYAALLIGRYWRALGAAIAVALALAAASLVALGPDPWLAFFRETEVARIFMENGKLSWTFMVTPFAAARLAGLDVQVAYALQAAVSCGALVALFVVWRRR